MPSGDLGGRVILETKGDVRGVLACTGNDIDAIVTVSSEHNRVSLSGNVRYLFLGFQGVWKQQFVASLAPTKCSAVQRLAVSVPKGYSDTLTDAASIFLVSILMNKGLSKA